jgi:acetylxylan esterase
MTKRLRFAAPAIASLATSLLTPSLSHAQACDAGWQCTVNYGGSTAMDLYVPSTVTASPAVVVSLHYCGGTAANAHSWFKSFADKYGFVIIAPKSGGSCFDATPQRSGERDAIVKMVQYVATQNKADTKRVFAAGASSGACMTQALLAAYPDVFAAGSSLAGVPAGAWTGGNAYGWSAPASTTAAQWGDKVRQADSGFSGTRPRIQLWQGQGDTTLTYNQAYPAQVAQWTNVFGVTDANATRSSVKPTGAQDTWDRTEYKNGSGTVVLEANSGPTSVPHDLTGRGLWTDVVRFFGLDATSGTGGTGTGGAGAGGTATSTGGASNRGGASSMGGTAASTGGTATSTGGASDRGGATSTGGTASSTGGASNRGGATSMGGATANPSGGAATGGNGTTTATGGIANTSVATGGASTGGSGGQPASSSGGSQTTTATGQSGATTTTALEPTADKGCSCLVASGRHSRKGALGALLMTGLGAILCRRRNRLHRDAG